MTDEQEFLEAVNRIKNLLAPIVTGAVNDGEIHAAVYACLHLAAACIGPMLSHGSISSADFETVMRDFRLAVSLRAYGPAN